LVNALTPSVTKTLDSSGWAGSRVVPDCRNLATATPATAAAQAASPVAAIFMVRLGWDERGSNRCAATARPAATGGIRRGT
ncbi:hypothetical protein KZ294_26175, partial [Escherichia coli]|nr:hypothetical protein [Escherichia coli]